MKSNIYIEGNFYREFYNRLRESTNKGKRDSVGSIPDEPSTMLDTVEGLKRRIETINVQAVSCLQSVKSKFFP